VEIAIFKNSLITTIMERENTTIPHAPVSEEEIMKHLDNVIAESKDKPGSLIPLLQHTQKMYGYLPEAAIRKISESLNIPLSEVAGIVGFYSFFSTTPKGKHVVRVCQGTACYVRGGNEVLAAVKNELNINVGETTKDRVFSLEVGRCFGACGLAPVIMINDDVIQRVKPAKIGELLKVYKNKP
jgi:NADH:ubiquinone oxidoreductase subunit E